MGSKSITGSAVNSPIKSKVILKNPELEENAY